VRTQTNKIAEKVGNVVIPIYPMSSNGYSGFMVAWYEGGKRCRKFFADKAAVAAASPKTVRALAAHVG
jgi:hypothetical protein